MANNDRLLVQILLLVLLGASLLVLAPFWSALFWGAVMALFSLLPTSHAVQFYAGRDPARVGNRHPLSTPFGCFATADGQAVIAGPRSCLAKARPSRRPTS